MGKVDTFKKLLKGDKRQIIIAAYINAIFIPIHFNI